jgi:hypothetical protein
MIGNMAKTLETARTVYSTLVRETEEEMKHLISRRKQEKLHKKEQKKAEVRDIQRKVKWRSDSRQWSSAQSPDLSPIAQSTRSMTLSSGKFLWPIRSSRYYTDNTITQSALTRSPSP